MLSFGVKAQNTRDVDAPKPAAPVYQSSKAKKTTTVKKGKAKKESDSEVFRKRLKKVFREKAKMERKMEKPQYSDPSYFGHKRKPKKRANGKKKFCKECGLTH